MEEARGDAGLSREFRFESSNALNDGLFILDGPLLERFGFGHQEAQRVHLSLVDTVEIVEKGGSKYLKLTGTPGFQTMAQPLDAADPQVEELANEIQGVIA